MPDFWDKLFKTDLPAGTPTYALNGVASAVYLYASGSVTAQQAADNILDSDGNAMSSEDATQAGLLIDIIDDVVAVPLVAFKQLKAMEVWSVLHTVELGWITTTTAKSLLGVS